MRSLGLLALLVSTHTAFADRAKTRTIYLNKTGITVSPGSNDSRHDRSSLVTMPTAVPAWNPSPEVWTQTVACLREMFVAYDVEITETDPGTSTQHLEAVFGGTPELLGRPSTSTGVSPYACNVIENSIVFVFTESLPNDGTRICELMAQEIGHSYALDHEIVAASPMSYLPYAGKRAFLDTAASCGESTARPCGPSGQPTCGNTQNDHARLVDFMGAAGTDATAAPTVHVDSPADGAHLDPSFEIDATIGDGVKLATLSIDGVTIAARTAPPWRFVAADLTPGAHTFELTASDGAHADTATVEFAIGDEVEMTDNVGCSAGRGGGWLGAVWIGVVVALRRRRRA